MLSQTKRLIECWRTAAGGSIPAWPDLHPRAIADLMPFLALAEAEEGGGYRIRLSGSGVTAFLGRETTGTSFAELGFGPFLGDLLRDHDDVLSRQVGLFIRHRLTLALDIANLEYAPVDYDTILLPIRSEPHGPPKRVLAGTFFENGSPPPYGVEGRIRDWRGVARRYVGTAADADDQ